MLLVTKLLSALLLLRMALESTSVNCPVDVAMAWLEEENELSVVAAAAVELLLGVASVVLTVELVERLLMRVEPAVLVLLLVLLPMEHMLVDAVALVLEVKEEGNGTEPTDCCRVDESAELLLPLVMSLLLLLL